MSSELPLIHIFADESCLGNQFEDRSNPGGAAGLVEHFNARSGWTRRDYTHFDPDTTNNRMALKSGILGLAALREPSRVVFTSDSQYLIKGMKEWVHGWARRGWKRKAGPIGNLELWKTLIGEAARHQVEWRWTRGHANHVKNEFADWLAAGTARDGGSTDGLVDSSFDAWLKKHQDAGKFDDFLDLPDDSFDADRPPPHV